MGSIVLNGAHIGAGSVIGAGAVVTRDVADFALVVGNPERHIGWVCRCGVRLNVSGEKAVCPACLTRFAIADEQCRMLEQTPTGCEAG